MTHRRYRFVPGPDGYEPREVPRNWTADDPREVYGFSPLRMAVNALAMWRDLDLIECARQSRLDALDLMAVDMDPMGRIQARAATDALNDALARTRFSLAEPPPKPHP